MCTSTNRPFPGIIHDQLHIWAGHKKCPFHTSSNPTSANQVRTFNPKYELYIFLKVRYGLLQLCCCPQKYAHCTNKWCVYKLLVQYFRILNNSQLSSIAELLFSMRYFLLTMFVTNFQRSSRTKIILTKCPQRKNMIICFAEYQVCCQRTTENYLSIQNNNDRS